MFTTQYNTLGWFRSEEDRSEIILIMYVDIYAKWMKNTQCKIYGSTLETLDHFIPDCMAVSTVQQTNIQKPPIQALVDDGSVPGVPI